jgi:HPt (histidine-containing phosphotransfer) domain-containing protein
MIATDHLATPTFSARALLERCLGNPAVAAMVLQSFERQLAHDLGEITAAVRAADGPRTARCAHALKGAAGAVAADALAAVAADIETRARATSPDFDALPLSELRDAIDRCLRHLPDARRALADPDNPAPRDLPTCAC